MAVVTHLTREQAVQIIHGTNGKLFSVEFTKRGDGSRRQMTARLGVRSHLKGGTKGYDAVAKNLITVFEFAKNAYRSISIEGITRLMVDGQWLPVVDTTPAIPARPDCCSHPVPDELGACDTCGRLWNR